MSIRKFTRKIMIIGAWKNSEAWSIFIKLQLPVITETELEKSSFFKKYYDLQETSLYHTEITRPIIYLQFKITLLIREVTEKTNKKLHTKEKLYHKVSISHLFQRRSHYPVPLSLF